MPLFCPSRGSRYRATTVGATSRIARRTSDGRWCFEQRSARIAARVSGLRQLSGSRAAIRAAIVIEPDRSQRFDLR